MMMEYRLEYVLLFISIFFIATKVPDTTRSKMKPTIFLTLLIVATFHSAFGVRPDAKKGKFYQCQTIFQELIFQYVWIVI